MKKQILITLVALSCFLIANAQSFEWAKSFGSNDPDIGYSISVDNSGNAYTTGYFEGTVDFDPGVGVSNLTSTGDRDIFIQKLDTSGNFIWAKSFGSLGEDKGLSNFVDNSGNIYTTGYYIGTVDFDPGTGVSNLTSNGAYDVFVQKMDPSGNFLWAKSFGGPAIDWGQSIVTDDLGNVYLTGLFADTVDFDPGAGEYNLICEGYFDVFIQKLDSSGNFLWADSWGSTGPDRGFSVNLDDLGNIYATGQFSDTVDFDSGTGTSYLTSEGFEDIFVLKLDTAGEFLWAHSFGGTDSYDRGNAIIVDTQGDVYTTGQFRETADFDPGPSVSNLTSSGAEDIFIQKMDASGNFLWAASFGGAATDKGLTICLDTSENVYFAGFFQGTADFDPSTGVNNVTSAGMSDVFIQKMDPSGNLIRTTTFGGTWLDRVRSIFVDDDLNVYTAGEFSATSDFDPGPGTSNFTTQGVNDIFVHKMSQCITAPGKDVINACNYYTWIDGKTYLSDNNTATYTLTNAAGCDSVVTLDLTILNSTTGTDVQTACDSYSWIDGNTYTSSNNTATHTLTNVAGCDSIVTLELTINTIDSSVTQLDGVTLEANTSGASYEWLDCNNNYQPISGETAQTFEATINGSYAVQLTANNCTDTSDCFVINSVGLPKQGINQVIELFPNPTAGKVSIMVDGFEVNSITLTNAQGKNLRTIEVNNGEFEVDLSRFPTGVYFMHFESEERTIIKRVVRK